MKKAILVLASLLLAANVHATKSVTSEDGPSSASCSGLKFASGPKDKGYSSLYGNIAAVCMQRQITCEVRTTGGLANTNILATKKADVGLMQRDTLRDMASGNEAIAALQVVATMNYNYLHVLTATQGYKYDAGRAWYGLKNDPAIVVVRKFSDLKGRTVALVGTAQLLGQALAQRQLKDYGLKFEYPKDDKEALEWVKTGRVQALFTVSGAPYTLIEKLTMNDGLSLVPFDEDFGDLYQVRKITYPNIGANGVKALAIQNLLVARDFGPEKAQQVANLKQCLVDNLQNLKDGEYESAWNEMKLDQNVDMPKFVAPVNKRGSK